MGSITVDAQTFGLKETIAGVRGLPEVMVDVIGMVIQEWYDQDFLPTVDRIIVTGEPMGTGDMQIHPNIGLYRKQKMAIYGIDHGLGVLSGRLQHGVKMTQPRIVKTRGKEVRFWVRYDKPNYLVSVHEGKASTNFRRRRFIDIAQAESLPELRKKMQNLFKNVNLQDSPAQMTASAIAKSK